MELTMIGLFVLAILLFTISFFQKDRTKEVEKQLENISIHLMQELYQLKKKVSLLEEEALISNSEVTTLYSKKLSRDDVLTMHEEGYSVSEISSITQHEEVEIENLLSNS